MMTNRSRTRLAVSPAIAVVLLVAVTVLLSATVYVTIQDQAENTDKNGQAGVTMKQSGHQRVDITLVSPSDKGTVYVVSPLGTKTQLERAGEVRSAVAFSHKPTRIIVKKEGETYVSSSRTLEYGVNPNVTVAKDGSGDYTSLQTAINNVSNGTIIAVKQAHYNTSVTINESVHIVAETGTVFHPNSSSPAFTISATDVTLQNVLVDGRGSGTGIKVTTEDAEVAGTRLHNLKTGIAITTSCVAITGNHITNNYDGVRVEQKGNHTFIKRNDLSNNTNASIVHQGGDHVVKAYEDFWGTENPESTVYGKEVDIEYELDHPPELATISRGAGLAQIHDSDSGHGNECGILNDGDNTNGNGN